MQVTEEKIYSRFALIINLIYFLMIAAIIYLALKYALGLLLPLLIAWALASLLQKPITLLCERIGKLPQKAVAFAVVALFIATVGTTAALITTALFDEISGFVQSIPLAVERFLAEISNTSRLNEMVSRLPEWVRPSARELLKNMSEDLPGFLRSAFETLSQPLFSSVSALGSFAMKLPSFFISLMITLISLIFITTDYSEFTSLLKLICPEHLKLRASRLKRYSFSTAGRLAKTYAFLMLLTFTELSVGFALMNLFGAGIGYIVPLAFLIALVDILPVLGVGTILIPWALFEFLRNNNKLGMMLVILYIVIVVVRNFLEPKLVGERFGLHPAVTLTALYVGGRLFGFVGVFALPLLIILAKQLHDSSQKEKAPVPAK